MLIRLEGRLVLQIYSSSPLTEKSTEEIILSATGHKQHVNEEASFSPWSLIGFLQFFCLSYWEYIQLNLKSENVVL